MVAGRLQTAHPSLHVPYNILQHNDCVVYDETDGKRQRHEG